MNKFRASYTVLHKWASGNWDDAVKMYFKLDSFTTEAMADGRDYHEKWKEYILNNKQIPVELGGGNLKNPRPEEKLVVELGEWIDLVGVIDCIDDKIIYEWKTGITSSSDGQYERQVGIYGLLATMKDIEVEKCEVRQFNQHANYDPRSVSIKWITPKLLRETADWIETHASSMHDYLEKNGLYSQLGGK